jgi:hypothetical protein
LTGMRYTDLDKKFTRQNNVEEMHGGYIDLSTPINEQVLSHILEFKPAIINMSIPDPKPSPPRPKPDPGPPRPKPKPVPKYRRWTIGSLHLSEKQ